MISESTKKRLECIPSVKPMGKPKKDGLFTIEILNTSKVGEHDSTCNTTCLLDFFERGLIRLLTSRRDS